jgi:hypothetical protein
MIKFGSDFKPDFTRLSSCCLRSRIRKSLLANEIIPDATTQWNGIAESRNRSDAGGHMEINGLNLGRLTYSEARQSDDNIERQTKGTRP